MRSVRAVKEPYPLDERRDPDLWPLRSKPTALRRALSVRCRCGHARGEHMGATGTLAAFGGSACDLCWSCGTFEAEDRVLWLRLTRVRSTRR
jgi:hypothetical protein